jgi:CRP-like cAMP-binding protein
MDDFLELRIIAVAGSAAMLFFTYFHPHGRVLWLPFKWNLLFIAINSYRIGNVYAKRLQAEKLPAELMKIRDDHFYVLDPVDFYKLVHLGRRETFKPGDLVVAQGNMNRFIRLVVDGELKVLRDGYSTYSLEEGNFVSEAGLHAGLLLPGGVESCCTIVAAETTHTLCWDRTELMDFLRREKATRSALKAALSWDIVRKLKWQRGMLAEHKIENPEQWTQKRNEQNFHRYASILQNMLYHPQYLRERKKELTKYRMVHHIDDEHHRMALKACGWTPEEFEVGYKEGQEELHEEDEINRGILWRIQDFYLRVFDRAT